jgi:hypothetical protein
MAGEIALVRPAGFTISRYGVLEIKDREWRTCQRQTITGGYAREEIRGGLEPGMLVVANPPSTGVVLVNNAAVPVFVPYGQR